MLFNSYLFIFAFLPIAVGGYMAVNLLASRRLSLTWLVLVSIVFYGIWNPINLLIIAPSIALNYLLARWIQEALRRDNGSGERLANALVIAGVAFNICFLGYFKYKNFFLDSMNELAGTQFALSALILPLGISFITFQKIAFLVDTRAGVIEKFDLFDFLVFVFFFPQLIAGPIVHYREMMPQFEQIKSRIDASDLAVGAGLFAMGLFKKVVLADGVAAYATPAFDAAARGEPIGFLAAWMGVTAYTFQIYFDFSGYSDMAIGLARLFGIRLPFNFNSPLKSSSIIEFWSRWHVTLTRFLTAYVYTPVVMHLTRSRMRAGKPVLGRKKPTVSAFIALIAGPTVLTMFLSGFWHGAGATFLVWGLMHGAYLVINHAWRQWRPKWDPAAYDRIMKPLGWLITFSSVVAAMAFFRAKTTAAAATLVVGMTGANGISIPQAVLARAGGLGTWLSQAGIAGDASSGTTFMFGCLWLIVLFTIVMFLPNSLEMWRKYEPALYFEAAPAKANAAPATSRGRVARALDFKVTWNKRWAFISATMFVLGALGLNRVSEFLYWQF
jgi:alginate O-acetyltransferase complex protein AlgI